MSSPDRSWTRRAAGVRTRLALAAATLLLGTAASRATLPPWLQHVTGASAAESALYRLMTLPGVQVLYPRAPKDSQAELQRLIAEKPAEAELYALRARTDESALDMAAAESDWRLYAAHAADPGEGKLELAGFFHRQMQTAKEIATLREIGAAPPLAAERFAKPSTQRSWIAFERILSVCADQALPADETRKTYEEFLTRYPDQPAVYARFFEFLLDEKQYPAAEGLIARFRSAFPGDAVFPIRAQALLEYRRGNAGAALAVYEHAFQPMWPADLLGAYFALLKETHRERAFVAEARARLAAHPDGPEALNALARIFYYQQQEGRSEQAQQTLDAFRIAREQRGGTWSAEDLYTLATLSGSIHSYAEQARYDYALAASKGALPNGEAAAQQGLAGLVEVLLTAPDQPIALGAGNLTLYRDIATLDTGPGYWNGVLSLWLNGTSPQTEYDAETAKAQSYFHRAKAAELLRELDGRFGAAPERAGLHVALMHAYAEYGEPRAVIVEGRKFLAGFPASSQRMEVVNLMADAYARQRDPGSEFALYEETLRELAARLKPQTGGMPLSAAGRPDPAGTLPAATPASMVRVTPGETEEAIPAAGSPAYSLDAYVPAAPANADAVAYAALLDRALGRLVAEKQLPRALALLRGQLDLSPDEPLLYERLATFLEQNNLSNQQESIYRTAAARFAGTGWYDKLARLYLRERNREAYAALTRQVTDIFSGTELDAWFAKVGTLPGLSAATDRSPGARLALQLNLYAEKRFPHDLVFTRNLLNAYQTNPTRDPAAYEGLLRRHWWQDDELRGRFFDLLSSTARLQAELDQLRPLAKPGGEDAAAIRELAEAQVWLSQFEQAAPLMGELAERYPADTDLGDRASSLFRSLSYLDTTAASLNRAVAIQKNLLAANPRDETRLATLGDLYAEATATGGEDLPAAAPYWHRIPQLQPGSPAGYLTSATIFWDYFQFGEAQAQIKAARMRFKQPALYGYESGAIAEDRRDLPAAVNEYTAAATQPLELTLQFNKFVAVAQAYFSPPSDAADSNLRSTAQSFFGSGAARARLLRLAGRPASRALVDSATAAVVTQHPAEIAALTLRADVLVAQHREKELPAMLAAALSKCRTVEEASAVGVLGQQHELPEVYERALETEISLSADPVEKIQLSYTLASTLEAHRRIPEATRIIEAVYRANPRTLGVVRATTDFYARTGQPKPAIATLLEAARAATPQLAHSFTLEAAQRANAAGETAQARQLGLQLLAAAPYDAEVLGIIAASYSRSHDDAGLKAFYEARLQAVRTATLPGDERRQDTALLRRGIIPALTGLKDYQGAMDQYIALLSAYPEDSATAQEAALYALRYQRKAQLVEFLRSTVQHSPQDSRFAVLLAQVDTTFEDMPGALAAYNAAIAVRKDRADLYEARAELEVRLSSTPTADAGLLDAAAADFDRLYLLTYKDPAWMIRLGEVRARQHRAPEAVKALEMAYVAGRPAGAGGYFQVASQLAAWNLLAEARVDAEKGVALAGADLLVPGDTSGTAGGGAAVYARILTRLGHADEALARLIAVRREVDANPGYPAGLAQQLAEQGIGAADQAAQRKAYVAQRQQTADAQMQQAVAAIGETVQAYFTPDQQERFAAVLDGMHASGNAGKAGRASDAALALSLASAAGLADREAEWRRQILLGGPLRQAAAQRETYVALQERRMQYTELAKTMEAYAARQTQAGPRDTALKDAVHAWHASGDESNELRVTRTLALRNDAGVRDRFFDLLLRHDHAAFAALAGGKSNDTLADAAVNYAVTHSDEATALAAVAARGGSLPAVWRPASASLVRTYFADAQTPPVSADFMQALRPEATIAERLSSHADPAQQLTGDRWFFYASRYGIYLGTARRMGTQGDAAEDFLPAALERAPANAASYLDLAQSYAEAGDAAGADREFSHALELAPDVVLAHDAFALALFPAQRARAVEQWRQALEILRQMQERNNFPETFFTGLGTVLQHLGERKLGGQFRPEIEGILRPYVARNGNYRSNELLRAAYRSASSPEEGSGLVLSLAGAAADPDVVLIDLHNAGWLQPPAREAILLRRVELARAHHEADSANNGTLLSRQLELIEFYLGANQVAKAKGVSHSMGEAPQHDLRLEADGIVIAVRSGALAPLLDRWKSDSESVPADEPLDRALLLLRRPAPGYSPDAAAIRPLAEFILERKQLTNALRSTDFLAVAQLRLETGDLPGAVSLLNRLALRPADGASLGAAVAADAGEGRPYANLDAAAALLESSHHAAEAVPFLSMLSASAPWDAGYRLRLAQAERDAGQRERAARLFAELAASADVRYEVRAAAATAMRGSASGATNANGGELALLASGRLTPASARQPRFVRARIAAASDVSLAVADRAALLQEALAIAPRAPGMDRVRLDLLVLEAKAAPAAGVTALYEQMQQAPATAEMEPEGAAEAANSDAESTSSSREIDDEGSAVASLPAGASVLPLATRLELAEGLATAYQHEDKDEAALGFLELAMQLGKEAQGRVSPAVTQRRDALRASIALQRRNESRRPLLHKDLEQANEVRPRLTAVQMHTPEMP